MKKFLLFLILLIPSLSYAQTPVTGHVRGGSGSATTSNTFVRFRLRSYSGNTPRVLGVGTIVQPQFDVTPDGSGVITTNIYGNDVIDPTGTFWTTEFWYNGKFISSYNWLITGSSTFNLDSASPMSTAPQANSTNLLGSRSYTFQQTTPATTWTITHNFGDPNVLVECFDSNSKYLIPDTVVRTDLNTTTVTFVSAQSGSCTVLNGNSQVLTSSIGDAVVKNPTGNQTIIGSFSLTVPVLVSPNFTSSSINNTIFVDGIKYPRTDTGIQSAITDLGCSSGGGTVVLSTGVYNITTGNIAISCPIAIIGFGKGTILYVAAALGATTDIFVVNPTTDGNFIRFADFQILPVSGTPGRYGIHLNGATAEIQNFTMDRVLIQQLGSYGIYAEGSGLAQGTPVLTTIDRSQIYGGIVMTNAGDTVRITNSNITGTGKMDFSFQGGSSTLLLSGNNISVSGGVHIGTGAAFPIISNNEFETPVGFTGSNSAFLDLDGTMGSVIAGATVEGNNWQIVNSINVNSIRVNWADRTRISGGNYERSSGASVDILMTANSTKTRIFPATSFREASGANSTLAQVYTDSGTGNLVMLGGNNSPDNPLVYRDSSGTSYLYGNAAQIAVEGVGGATYLMDGNTNTPALVGGAAPSSQPTNATVATDAVHAFKEVAAPSGTAAYDVCYGDSTAHSLKCSYNNGTFNTVLTTTGTLTNGDLAQFDSSGRAVDSGILASSVGGAFTCVNVTPVTVNTNTASDQNLMSCTITANTLNMVKKTLLVQSAAVYSTPAASTTTVNIKLKLCTVSGCGSGTVITLASWTSAALGVIQATNDPLNATLNFTTQTAGGSASFESHGNLTIDISALTTAAEAIYADNNTATVGTIDSTAQLFLQETVSFGTASGSNSMTQRQLVVDSVD